MSNNSYASYNKKAEFMSIQCYFDYPKSSTCFVKPYTALSGLMAVKTGTLINRLPDTSLNIT